MLFHWYGLTAFQTKWNIIARSFLFLLLVLYSTSGIGNALYVMLLLQEAKGYPGSARLQGCSLHNSPAWTLPPCNAVRSGDLWTCSPLPPFCLQLSTFKAPTAGRRRGITRSSGILHKPSNDPLEELKFFWSTNTSWYSATPAIYFKSGWKLFHVCKRKSLHSTIWALKGGFGPIQSNQLNSAKSWSAPPLLWLIASNSQVSGIIPNWAPGVCPYSSNNRSPGGLLPFGSQVVTLPTGTKLSVLLIWLGFSLTSSNDFTLPTGSYSKDISTSKQPESYRTSIWLESTASPAVFFFPLSPTYSSKKMWWGQGGNPIPVGDLKNHYKWEVNYTSKWELLTVAGRSNNSEVVAASEIVGWVGKDRKTLPWVSIAGGKGASWLHMPDFTA